MPLIPYEPDPHRYDDVFVTQIGSGLMTRYRGNYQNGSGFFPQILKSLFSKVSSFIQPLLQQAAPHAKAALNAAIPHLQNAADGAIKEASTLATQAISKRFQQGSGRKITRKRRTNRIPPYNIPDSF